MLSRQHINMHFLDLLLFVEVGYNCFRTNPNRLVSVNLSSRHFLFDIHPFRWSFSLMGQTLSVPFFDSTLFLMISWASQSRIRIMSGCKYILAHFKSQSFKKCRIWAESFVEIDFEDGVSWNIWSLLIKPAMDENIVLNHEANMPKPIDIGQFVPIWRICVIDIERHRLSYLIASASDYHEQSSNKHTTMLVALGWSRIIPIWSSHPIQPTISVLSQAPCII